MGPRAQEQQQRLIWIVAGVLVVALLGAGTVVVLRRTVFKDTPGNHIAKAEAYAQNGQMPEAILEYRRAIQLDGMQGEVRLKLGDAYAQVNEPVNAIREYVRASDLLPANVDAQLKAASGLLLAGRFEDARARADKVLAQDPKNTTAQILRGNALAGLKDFDGAVAEYENAVAANPSQHEAFVNLGAIQSLKGMRRRPRPHF